MAVVRAQIQTVEEIYKLVWTAVANKRPMEASYQGRHQAILPASTGPESGRTASRAVLSVRRRKPDRTPAVRVARKLALYCARKTQRGEVSRGCLAHSTESFTPRVLCT